MDDRDSEKSGTSKPSRSEVDPAVGEAERAAELVATWRQEMARDDLMAQVLADSLLEEAINVFAGAIASIADPRSMSATEVVHGYADAVALRCLREQRLNFDLGPREYALLPAAADGHLDRAESLLRDLINGPGEAWETAPLLVRVLLNDWSLRASPATLDEAEQLTALMIGRADQLQRTDPALEAEIGYVGAAWRWHAKVLAARPPDPTYRPIGIGGQHAGPEGITGAPDDTESQPMNTDALTEATAAAFRAACANEHPPSAVEEPEVARPWSEWAVRHAHWSDAVVAYELVEAALRARVQELPSFEECVPLLADLTGVATDVAVARALDGDPGRAAEGLERDRGLLYQKVLTRRAADFGFPAWDTIADLVARVPDAAVAFLVPGSVTGLLLVARFGEPVHFELAPELTAASVEDYVGSFDGAVHVRGGRTEGRSVYSMGSEGLEDDSPQHALDVLTGWLWDAAMRRIVHLSEGRRLVLVPAGLLVTAPLHLAWRPDPEGIGGRRYVLDDCDVSYLPSLAMAPVDHSGLVPGDAAVGVVEAPAPVSARELPKAAAEAVAVMATFPQAVHLPHEEATKQAVASALTSCEVVHLICHGASDPVNPLDSHLLLGGDEELRVADLLEMDLSGLRLAVLSACESARPSLHIPEAAVSLPAALLIAGAGGVVGSLWEADDADTALLMAKFHQLLTGHSGANGSGRHGADSRPADHRGSGALAPGAALSTAQRWMRATTNEEKRTEFPDLVTAPEIAGPGRTLWASARSRPLQWGNFTYMGA